MYLCFNVNEQWGRVSRDTQYSTDTHTSYSFNFSLKFPTSLCVVITNPHGSKAQVITTPNVPNTTGASIVVRVVYDFISGGSDYPLYYTALGY